MIASRFKVGKVLRARQYHISGTYLCIHPAVKHSLGALGKLGATPGEEEVLAVLGTTGAQGTSLWVVSPPCHISLRDTTGWPKPNEHAGCSARSPVVLLAHAPAEPYQRGGKVCEHTRLYVLLPALA